MSTGPKVVRIGTWNIRNLSTRNDQQRRYDLIVAMILPMHVIALQEVMEVAVLDKIKAMLPSHFKYVVSKHSVGRDGGRREYYAFFYNTREIRVITSGLFDDSAHDFFRREPFAATFKSQWGFDFTMLTIHVLYGKSKRERRPELPALARALQLLREKNGAEENIIMVGDFNFPPTDRGWADVFKLGYVPLVIPPGKTTVGSVSLYDNIWMRAEDVRPFFLRMGMIKFDHIWYNPGEERRARREVSDHRLVWASLRADRDFDDDDYGDLTRSLILE